MTTLQLPFAEILATAEETIVSKDLPMGETLDLVITSNHYSGNSVEHPPLASARLSRTLGMPLVTYPMYNRMVAPGMFKAHAKVEGWKIGHFIQVGIAFSGYFLIKHQDMSFYTLEVVLKDPMPLGSKNLNLEIHGFTPVMASPTGVGYTRNGPTRKSGKIIVVEESWKPGSVLERLKTPDTARDLVHSFLQVREFTMAPMDQGELIKAMMVYSFRDNVNVLDRDAAWSEDVGVSHVSYVHPDGREMNFVGIDYRLP